MVYVFPSCRRQLIAALAAACALMLPVAPARGADEGARVLTDDWYTVYLNGGKAGYQYEQVTERAGDAAQYETRAQTDFAVRRGNVSMHIADDTTVTEDADGRLVAFRKVQTQGPQTVTWEGKVEGKEMVLTTSTAFSTDTKRLPVPDGLCPWALRRLEEKMGRAPGTKYTAKAFVPDVPDRSVEVGAEAVGREDVQVFEVTKRLDRTDIRISIMPGVATSQWTDDAGTVWLIRVQMLGNLTLESRKTTREMAISENDSADILAASVIATDRPIPSPRSLERLEIVLEPTAKSTQVPNVSSDPYQQVRREPNGLHVTLQRAHASPAKSYKLPYAGQEYAELLKPNTWLETADPVVAGMGREAVKGETDALKAAQAIEAYVRSAVTEKGLSLGFATAAETAAQKSGDCTEHAVLVAALARAAGMPSRVVGGLAYAEKLPGAPNGGFGYHMWAEVYVGEWLPLDAALGSHDATHLALVRSALNEPSDLFAISSAISRMFGTVKVRVIDARQ